MTSLDSIEFKFTLYSTSSGIEFQTVNHVSIYKNTE